MTTAGTTTGAIMVITIMVITSMATTTTAITSMGTTTTAIMATVTTTITNTSTSKYVIIVDASRRRIRAGSVSAVFHFHS